MTNRTTDKASNPTLHSFSTVAILAAKVAADQARVDPWEAEDVQERAAAWELLIRNCKWSDCRTYLDRGWTIDVRRGQTGGATYEPPARRVA